MFLENSLNTLKINMDYQKLLAELKLGSDINHLFSMNHVLFWKKDTIIWMFCELIKNNEQEYLDLFKIISLSGRYMLEAMLSVYKGLVYLKNLNLEFPVSLRRFNRYGNENYSFEEYFRPYEQIFEKYWKHSTIFIILCGKSVINKKLPTDLFRLLKTFLPEYSFLPEKDYETEVLQKPQNFF
jgi:hypothetical protein